MSSSIVQGVLRGRGARKEALEKLAELEGTTKWNVTLNLLPGAKADAAGLADGLTEASKAIVLVTEVACSLLSSERARCFVSVAVNGLDGLASVVGQEVSGYGVESIENVEAVHEDAATSPSKIQGILQGRAVRREMRDREAAGQGIVDRPICERTDNCVRDRMLR